MIVEEKKWLEKNLLLFGLMQEKDALCWFHERNYDPLSGCHVTACFQLFCPYIADVSMFMGSFVWRVGQEMEVPIGGIILHVSRETMGKP